MKNSIQRITILFLILLSIIGCSSNSGYDIEQKINNIKQKFAPDSRVAIFDIQFDQSDGSIILKGESNIKKGVDALLEELKKNNLNIKNKVKILPDENLGDLKYGIINLSVANIRSKPKHYAELATQSLLGTCVNIFKKEDNWYLVQTPDNYIGWVDDEGIYKVNELQQNKWKDSDRIIITEQYTSAFQFMDENGPKISDLVIGDILRKNGEENGYTEIEFPDGRKGFIKSNEAVEVNNWINSAIANHSTILNTAKTFMGIPYLWGGTSSKGFDCSGFTKTIYYLNGVILPRDASQQVFTGELVNTESNFDSLRVGDLLFFGRKAEGEIKEKITHVAVYIGDKKYIHASGMVKINSLNKNDEDFNKYRYDTFIKAKRIIGNYDTGENLVKNNKYYVN